MKILCHLIYGTWANASFYILRGILEPTSSYQSVTVYVPSVLFLWRPPNRTAASGPNHAGPRAWQWCSWAGLATPHQDQKLPLNTSHAQQILSPPSNKHF